MSMEKPAIPLKNMIKLWDLCNQFIKEQKISGPDTIYQCDHVMENAYYFMAEIGNIVGYTLNEADDE